MKKNAHFQYVSLFAISISSLVGCTNGQDPVSESSTRVT